MYMYPKRALTLNKVFNVVYSKFFNEALASSVVRQDFGYNNTYGSHIAWIQLDMDPHS